MNCKNKGYKVGDIFKKIEYVDGDNFNKGAILVLSRDDSSDYPYFKCIAGDGNMLYEEKVTYLRKLTRIWPENDKVSITCEGKTVEISRESAKALKLI
jgi:hypothetical protein